MENKKVYSLFTYTYIYMYILIVIYTFCIYAVYMYIFICLCTYDKKCTAISGLLSHMKLENWLGKSAS